MELLMKYAKNKRIVDRALLDSYHEVKCLVCNVSHGTCAHHIKTKKSGGHDMEFNLVPLCVRHHLEIHQHGTEHFAQKYSLFMKFLIQNNWEKVMLPDGSHKWMNCLAR